MTEALAETLATAAIAGGGILAFLMLSLFFVKTFLVIGRPNQLLVFSGRENTLDDGTKVGWHYIAGGRRLRIPLLEYCFEAVPNRSAPIAIRAHCMSVAWAISAREPALRESLGDLLRSVQVDASPGIRSRSRKILRKIESS